MKLVITQELISGAYIRRFGKESPELRDICLRCKKDWSEHNISRCPDETIRHHNLFIVRMRRALRAGRPIRPLGTRAKVKRLPKVEKVKKVETVPFGQFQNGILKDLIPQTDKAYKPQRVGDTDKSDIDVLGDSIKHRLNILLLGETGTGKTHCLRHLSYQIGLPYMRVNLNGGTTPEDLVGQWIPKKDGPGFEWADGVLTRMLRHGGLFVCDEINAANAEILFVLHSLLDDERKVVLVQKDGEVVKAHPDFVFAATMNPTGYEGTKPLNLALFDRFDIVLDFKNNADKFAPTGMREAIKRIKDGILSGDIMGAISVRGIQQFVRNRELFGREVAKEIFLQKFEGVGRETVEHLLDTISEVS